MFWLVLLGFLYWPLLIILVAVLSWRMSGGGGRDHTPGARVPEAERSATVVKEQYASAASP
jgi:hypothetical protein